MANQDRFAAQLLESGARGYTVLATERLLARRPDLNAADAGASWRAHLMQRLVELQTAAALGRPALFVERVRWSRRAYSARNVAESELRDALACLHEVLAEELPEPARAAVVGILARALADFDHPVEIDHTALDPRDDVDRRALRYLLLVLEGRPREAIEEVLVAHRDHGFSLLQCIVDILLPAQREIGRLWHMGDSDVAEEHLVTATTKRAIAILAHVAPATPATGRVALIAAVAGDTHDVGGQALAALLEAEGWRCVDLGGDVPSEDLVSAYLAFDPEVVVLSATLSHHLPSLERSVRMLRAQAGGAVRILVSGSALAEVEELAGDWGADEALHDLPHAIERVDAAS